MAVDMADSRRDIDRHLLERLAVMETKFDGLIGTVTSISKDHEDRLRALESTTSKQVWGISFVGALLLFFREKVSKLLE